MKVSIFLSFFFICFLLLLNVQNCSKSPSFHSNWKNQQNRIWIGPDYWANRLQDWQVKNGRLECLINSDLRPMRVVHLLTGAVVGAEGNLEVTVKTGPIDSGNLSDKTWTGFLIGAGEANIDYRITALVHHKPAEDGGMFAGIDGTGQIIFRDFSKGGGGDTWSMIGKIPENGMPLLKMVSQTGEGLSGKKFENILLNLQVNSSKNGSQLRLAAMDEKGVLISQASLENVPLTQINGNIALVSHLGPEGSEKGYWFSDWNIGGSKFVLFPERHFGPILSAQHTLNKNVLKLTAQMPPLSAEDTQNASLEIQNSAGIWEEAVTSRLIDDSYTFPFKIENWDSKRDTKYRVVYHLKESKTTSQTYHWEGTIRKDPVDKDEIVVAAFTGHKIFTGGLKWNHNGIWFPHNELVAAINYHQPDFMFFSGDQVYEGDLTGAQYEPEDQAILDYLDKWYRWCWAFGDLARDIPTVSIPDDHDVYHGNIWGAGGKKAPKMPPDGNYPSFYEGFQSHWQQDQGGYKMSSEFVNMVQRTQSSHLPDPFDPTPVQQGIGVYYTDLNIGGISFAVIEDRKWKSSPTLSKPELWIVNGFVQNPNVNKYDKKVTDNPNAVLLGDRQLQFLESWAQDWEGVWIKSVLSQTVFATISTYPKKFITDAGTPNLQPYPVGVIPDGYERAVDMDSNGWPQTARDKALKVMRKAYAFHIAGDQHLGTTIQYGIENWHDAGYAVCVPSIGNTWPRRWYPEKAGLNYKEGDPKYTGDYRDGFGNLVSVLAVSNPIISNHEPANLHDRAPGYGIIRFVKSSRDIEIEVWPRWEDPSKPGARQYPGWPIKINQMDNFGQSAKYYLPKLTVSGMKDPIVQVINDSTADIVYTVRIKGQHFIPRVLKSGTYSVNIGELGGEKQKSIKNIVAIGSLPEREIQIDF